MHDHFSRGTGLHQPVQHVEAVAILKTKIKEQYIHRLGTNPFQGGSPGGHVPDELKRAFHANDFAQDLHQIGAIVGDEDAPADWLRAHGIPGSRSPVLLA